MEGGGVSYSLTATELSGSHTWCLSSIMACSCASWPPGVTTRPPLGVITRVYLRVGVLPCLLSGRDPPEEFGLKMSGNTGGRVASTIKPGYLSRLTHRVTSATPAAPFIVSRIKKMEELCGPHYEIETVFTQKYNIIMSCCNMAS